MNLLPLRGHHHQEKEKVLTEVVKQVLRLSVVLEVVWDAPCEWNGYKRCSGVEQGMRKRNSKISVEKEVQTKIVGSGDIHGVYHQIKVECNLGKSMKRMAVAT